MCHAGGGVGMIRVVCVPGQLDRDLTMLKPLLPILTTLHPVQATEDASDDLLILSLETARI